MIFYFFFLLLLQHISSKGRDNEEIKLNKEIEKKLFIYYIFFKFLFSLAFGGEIVNHHNHNTINIIIFIITTPSTSPQSLSLNHFYFLLI